MYFTGQYWGWYKHQYREIYKERFNEAKKAAYECFDACPVDVIWQFFNRSWQFMDAYQWHLTEKVAKWAVNVMPFCFLCLILSGAHYCLVLIFRIYLVLPAFATYWTSVLTRDYRDLDT